MNEVPKTIARWLEQKRHKERASAAVISGFALGGGMAVFLLTALLIYSVLHIVGGAFVRSVVLPGALAVGITAWLFARIMERKQDERELGMDPMGFWILKDICSFGPRLMLEGLRNLRRCGQLGELDVAGCARALGYLAGQNAAVTPEEVMRHYPHRPWPRLKGQLLLLDGVLFLEDDADRVTLMDPFRLRLRWMLAQDQRSGKAQEPARPKPEPAPQALPVNAPENLSAYEILGLSASASLVEIRIAYRKRVKECHPDLFAGMDQQAKDLAERWTKALNAAYSTLKNQQGRVIASSPGRR